MQRRHQPNPDGPEQRIENLVALRSERRQLLAHRVSGLRIEQRLRILKLRQLIFREGGPYVGRQGRLERRRESVREQAAEHRHPQGATDRPRELRQRGHHAKLIERHGILRRQREHRHRRPEPQPDDHHVAHHRDVARARAHLAQQEHAQAHHDQAEQAHRLVAAGATDHLAAGDA